MADERSGSRDATVTDTVDRIRADRFSDVDRGLVLELLALHAGGVVPDNVARLVDEAIAAHAGEVA